MSSDLAKKIAAEQAYKAGQRSTGLTASGNRGGCGCPPQYSTTPDRFSVPKDFPINRGDCGSPLGGFAEARGLAGYSQRAGQVAGGVDQDIPSSTGVTADGATVPFDTGQIPLPNAGGIVSQVSGMAIRKLSLFLAGDGTTGAEAFNPDQLYNNGTLYVRQGDNLLYKIKLFKLKVTDFGRLGFDCEIHPVPSDFSGVTFQAVGSVNTDQANDYVINGSLTAQWA